jgi:hypothetical protein
MVAHRLNSGMGGDIETRVEKLRVELAEIVAILRCGLPELSDAELTTDQDGYPVDDRPINPPYIT